MALDLSNPPAPPRTARATQEVKRKAVGKTAQREEAANGIFQLAGFGLIVTRQYADAGAINLHGGNIAHELAMLSERSEPIAKGLDYIMDAGPYAGLIVAVMPLALQIMANHNMIRADLVAGGGVVPPQALESQVKAEMARQAAEALRAQEAAEEELALLGARMAAQNPPEEPSEPPEPSNGQTPPAKSRQRSGGSS